MWEKTCEKNYTAFDNMVSLWKRDNYYDLSISLGTAVPHYDIFADNWDEAKQKAEIIIIKKLKECIDGYNSKMKRYTDIVNVVENKNNIRIEGRRLREVIDKHPMINFLAFKDFNSTRKYYGCNVPEEKMDYIVTSFLKNEGSYHLYVIADEKTINEYKIKLNGDNGITQEEKPEKI